MSDNKIPLAGVIGSPIAHSRSPRLHGYWLKKYGIAGHYIPMDIAPSDLAEAVQTLPRLGFVGINVTIPHKEAMLGLADIVTDRAALIGAANTIIFRKDGKVHADNTDGYGFIQNLIEGAPGWSASKGPAAVLGAGGASRAIVSSLLEAGAPEVRLSNRTRARADALRKDFGAKVNVFDWVKAGEMMEGCATVVNTTSLGMTGKPELKVSLDYVSSDAVVTDLVYTPLQTDFLSRAAEKGCITVDGLGMLIHQATPGFERWFGQKPEIDDDLREILLAE